MQIKKILFITLSNIGDVVLTLPVLDVLRANFPEAKVTVMCGPRPKEIFENNPFIDKLIVYEKHSKLKEKIKLFNLLKKERFGLVVDLRNTFFGRFLPAKYKNLSFRRTLGLSKHMKDVHLFKSQVASGKWQVEAGQEKSLYISKPDREYIDRLLKKNNINDGDKIFIVAPGARSDTKRWAKEKFIELVSSLSDEFRAKVVLAGDKDDTSTNKYIAGSSKQNVIDLTARTTIPQLAALIKKASCVITNDSAVLHISSYMDVPTIAIFGPTDEAKYGPWSKIFAVAKKDIACRPCEKAQCRFGTLKCMQSVKTEDVLRQVRNILAVSHKTPGTGRRHDFRRILIVRTDRIGDVLLSTPVITALRDNYPHAYIAMMTAPHAKDIIEDNPYLDETIIYDKEGKHKKWRRSAKFSRNLKKKRFDIAIILHPGNRAHLVTFFSGIPRRVGYGRKLGFLLTDRIEHNKQLGEKHELEYNLDLLRYLGIEAVNKSLVMPLKPQSEEWVNELFKEKAVEDSDRLLAIHPCASCPSKIWPALRFAAVADSLIEKYGFKVLLIAGPRDITLAENVIKNMRHAAINLAGKTSVSQLASILKRCRLFISNDSGPVHIASAVGTPVISIFGRNQAGLSPRRWGPLGGEDKVLHKEVGCLKCLAHECKRDFACLKAISIEDVTGAADSILSY